MRSTRFFVSSLALVALLSTSACSSPEPTEPEGRTESDLSIRFPWFRDPYAGYRYRVRWQGREVLGAQTALGLGGASVTFERGMTRDSAFEAWAFAGGPAADVQIEVVDELGNIASSYTMTAVKVTQLQSLPNLDGSSSRLTVELIRFSH